MNFITFIINSLFLTLFFYLINDNKTYLQNFVIIYKYII